MIKKICNLLENVPHTYEPSDFTGNKTLINRQLLTFQMLQEFLSQLSGEKKERERQKKVYFHRFFLKFKH